MSGISFDKKSIHLAAFGILGFLIFLNLYYLYTGVYLSLFPILFQCLFIILFSTSNKLYRRIGLLLFGLIAIGSISGVLSILLNWLLFFLDETKADHTKFQLFNVLRHLSLSLIGSFFFISLLKTTVHESDQLTRDLKKWKRFNFRIAFRDSVLIRGFILLLSLGIGVVFGVLQHFEIATHSDYTLQLNYFEHFLLTFGSIFSVYRSKENFFSQSIILSLLNWILFLPFVLSNVQLWFQSFYIFLIEGIITVTFCYSFSLHSKIKLDDLEEKEMKR